jgi:hypothetical protein
MIAPNRLPQTPRRDDTQPAERASIRESDERHIPPTRPHSTLLYPQEFGAPPDTLLACQRLGRA